MRFYLYFDKITNLLLMAFNVLSDLYFFAKLRLRKILKRNKTLKRYHDRCFIVGTGPSLRQTDINKIKDADIITENFFFKSDIYKHINPAYHITVDEAFYNADNLPYLNKILTEHPNTKLLIKQSGLAVLNHPNVYAVYAKKVQYANYVNFNCCANMTATINVSIMAVQLALFLGYKEIYLLGTDFSEFVLKEGKVEQFYKDTGKQRMWGRKGVQLRWFSVAYNHHYALNNWAQKHGIQIYNATPGSYLDAYPYRDFDEVVK